MNMRTLYVFGMVLGLMTAWGCTLSDTAPAPPQKAQKDAQTGLDTSIRQDLIKMARTPKGQHRVIVNVLDEGGKGVIDATIYVQCPDGSRHDATMLTAGLYFVHIPLTCAGDGAGIVAQKESENRPAQRKPMLELRQSVSFVLVKQGDNEP